MSQGRSAIEQVRNDVQSHPGKMLFRMIAQGRSFSGHERNCCFLNTGGTRFADISAISGLDFDDDGRAIGIVDWDLDGDLDIWIANRSGPQLRFLRNDMNSDNHYLAIRLQGRSCNRDAIGARLELVIKGETNHKQIKTLRAGEGFLAQSSKWIHFGLGRQTEVERLNVHWPGGEVETFTGLNVDQRFRLVQGSGQAANWKSPTRKIHLSAVAIHEPPPTERIQVFSASRVPMPPLSYTTFDRASVEVYRPGDEYVLLNLWASWCQPCRAELRDFAEHSDKLAKAGLQIVAVSIDGLDGNESGPQNAKEMASAMGLPFSCGLASASLVDKLQIVHDHLFGWHRPLPVPTSVLIDSSGRLAAIYKGPIEIPQLLSDLESLPLHGETLRRHSLPLAGRWLTPYSSRALGPLVRALIQAGHTDDSISYLQTHEARLSLEVENPKLLNWLGTELLKRGEVEAAIRSLRTALVEGADPAIHSNLGAALSKQHEFTDALEQFEKAMRLRNDSPMALNGAAWILATHPDDAMREPIRAVELAQRASELTNHQKPPILDTLAAAQAAVGQFESAMNTAQDAIRMAESAGAHDLVEQIHARLKLYKQSKPYIATIETGTGQR